MDGWGNETGQSVLEMAQSMKSWPEFHPQNPQKNARHGGRLFL